MLLPQTERSTFKYSNILLSIAYKVTGLEFSAFQNRGNFCLPLSLFSQCYVSLSQILKITVSVSAISSNGCFFQHLTLKLWFRSVQMWQVFFVLFCSHESYVFPFLGLCYCGSSCFQFFLFCDEERKLGPGWFILFLKNLSFPLNIWPLMF